MRLPCYAVRSPVRSRTGPTARFLPCWPACCRGTCVGSGLSHRGHAAVLAPQARQPALDVPEPAGTAADRGGDPRPSAPTCEGEPTLGTASPSRRDAQPRSSGPTIVGRARRHDSTIRYADAGPGVCANNAGGCHGAPQSKPATSGPWVAVRDDLAPKPTGRPDTPGTSFDDILAARSETTCAPTTPTASPAAAGRAAPHHCGPHLTGLRPSPTSGVVVER